MSDQVKNSEDRFSHNEAHLVSVYRHFTMITFFAFFHVDQSTNAAETLTSGSSEKKVDDFDMAVRELKFEIKGKVRI